MQDASAATRHDWWVICLCADWCGVCRDWRPVFAQAARDQPATRFAWVDIEDEAEALGEVDIQTFPTLLIACGAQARFLGPLVPSAQQLARLLATLRGQDAPAPGTPAEAQELLARLRVQVLPSAGL